MGVRPCLDLISFNSLSPRPSPRGCADAIISSGHYSRALPFVLEIEQEVAVEWQEIDGSKVDVLSDTFQMARDLILIRLCYAVGIWEISPNASGPESS